MYGELMNTESDEEKNVKYNVALCAQDSVLLEKKQRWLNGDIASENVHHINQSNSTINETDHEKVINKETSTVQGPTSYDEEKESQKAWTMEMPMMDSDISTTEADEKERIEESRKKFFYARAIHSSHMIQHHLQQIFECQRVVNEYRSLVDEERDIESSLYKTDLVINQHIMQMIDTDISRYEKTFGAILTKLWKIQNGKANTQISEENSEKELIDLCDESHVTLSDLRLYKREKEQKDCDDTISESVSSKAQKNWPRKSFQTNEDEEVESAMMCWENLEDSAQENQTRKMIGQDEDTNNDKEKQNNEEADEEHVESTVLTGNQLKIQSKNSSWE